MFMLKSALNQAIKPGNSETSQDHTQHVTNYENQFFFGDKNVQQIIEDKQ